MLTLRAKKVEPILPRFEKSQVGCIENEERAHEIRSIRLIQVEVNVFLSSLI